MTPTTPCPAAHPHRRHLTALAGLPALVAAGALLLGGCSDGAADTATDSTLTPVRSGRIEVSSRDNVFQPEAVTVAAGSTVEWRNDGRNDHNVKPVEGDAFGVDTEAFKPGDTYSHTFVEPGVYRYYCTLHATTTRGMIGTVEVVPR